MGATESGPHSLGLYPGRTQALVSSHWETTNPLKEGQGGHGCVWGGEGWRREPSRGRGVAGGGRGFLWG